MTQVELKFPKNRLQYYIKMLDDYRTENLGSHPFNVSYGFCGYMAYEFHVVDIKRILPELYNQKPLNADIYWWDSQDKFIRIKAIRMAIKEVKKLI